MGSQCQGDSVGTAQRLGDCRWLRRWTGRQKAEKKELPGTEAVKVFFFFFFKIKAHSTPKLLAEGDSGFL